MAMEEAGAFRVGKVAIVGRSNVGKSTLLNALVQQKVAIVSPKPQTTRSQIVAYHEDSRGQIFFLDTPGFYALRPGSAQYNQLIADSIAEADVIVYVVDHTRDYGREEERLWNMVLASEKPVILAVNKIDVKQPSFRPSYVALFSKEVLAVVNISALNQKHLPTLLTHIFALLPLGTRDTTVDYFPTPLLSLSGKEYLAEIIREKVYLLTGQEVPYRVSCRVLSVEEDPQEQWLRIDGQIIVSEPRYKAILIGKRGQKIEEIRRAVRKELELVTNKTVHLRLRVVTHDEIP